MATAPKLAYPAHHEDAGRARRASPCIDGTRVAVVNIVAPPQAWHDDPRRCSGYYLAPHPRPGPRRARLLLRPSRRDRGRSSRSPERGRRDLESRRAEYLAATGAVVAGRFPALHRREHRRTDHRGLSKPGLGRPSTPIENSARRRRTRPSSSTPPSRGASSSRRTTTSCSIATSGSKRDALSA